MLPRVGTPGPRERGGCSRGPTGNQLAQARAIVLRPNLAPSFHFRRKAMSCVSLPRIAVEPRPTGGHQSLGDKLINSKRRANVRRGPDRAVAEWPPTPKTSLQCGENQRFTTQSKSASGCRSTAVALGQTAHREGKPRCAKRQREKAARKGSAKRRREKSAYTSRASNARARQPER